MMNVLGNALRTLGNMLKDTKKLANIYFLFCFVSKHEEACKKALEIFFFSAKNNFKGDCKGIEKLKNIRTPTNDHFNYPL
jgi:hypothetical protein